MMGYRLNDGLQVIYAPKPIQSTMGYRLNDAIAVH